MSAESSVGESTGRRIHPMAAEPLLPAPGGRRATRTSDRLRTGSGRGFGGGNCGFRRWWSGVDFRGSGWLVVGAEWPVGRRACGRQADRLTRPPWQPSRQDRPSPTGPPTPSRVTTSPAELTRAQALPTKTDRAEPSWTASDSAGLSPDSAAQAPAQPLTSGQAWLRTASTIHASAVPRVAGDHVTTHPPLPPPRGAARNWYLP